jgi:hypothetical protein
MRRTITRIAVIFAVLAMLFGAGGVPVAAQDETPTPEVSGGAVATGATAETPGQVTDDTGAIITPPEAQPEEAPAGEEVQAEAAPVGGAEAPAAEAGGTDDTEGRQRERQADKVPSVGTGSAMAQAAHEQSLLLVALFGFLAVGAAWASRRFAVHA